MDDCTKLLIAAKTGITGLQNSYRELPDKGKFEAFLLFSILALKRYKEERPDKYNDTKERYALLIICEANIYLINKQYDYVSTFINSRFKLYNEEIKTLVNNGSIPPSLIYSNFYVNPLVEEQLNGLSSESFQDIIKFNSALIHMNIMVMREVSELLDMVD